MTSTWKDFPKNLAIYRSFRSFHSLRHFFAKDLQHKELREEIQNFHIN